MIQQLNSEGFPVVPCCEILGISTSGYYQYLTPSVRVREQEDQRLRPLILEIFHEHKRRYGARRIAAELRARDVPCGRDRVSRLMNELELVAIQPKSYRPSTTDSRHTLGYSPNRLLDRPLPTRLNEVYVGDITYLPLRGHRFWYLASLMDLCSRRIVGWAMADHMREELVLAALEHALSHRQPPAGLIHHSDRGGQYVGNEYGQRLENIEALSSMSRADNCYDNAFKESCFGTIKRELELEEFEDEHEALREVPKYMDYYNIRRRHSSLNYETPVSFEQKLLTACKEGS